MFKGTASFIFIGFLLAAGWMAAPFVLSALWFIIKLALVGVIILIQQWQTVLTVIGAIIGVVVGFVALTYISGTKFFRWARPTHIPYIFFVLGFIVAFGMESWGGAFRWILVGSVLFGLFYLRDVLVGYFRG